MPLRNREGMEGGCHFVTTSIAGFIRVFCIGECADIVIDSIKFCKKKFKFDISVLVIMPHHIHIILTVPESIKLSDIMRDFKKYTSVAIKRFLKEKQEYEKIFKQLCGYAPAKPLRSFKLWQNRFASLPITSEEIYATKFNYIVYNPVRSGLVGKPEDYPYLFFSEDFD
jgi:putative transposase